MMEIVTYPDPRLLAVSAEVTEFDSELRDIVTEMLRAMMKYGGAGIAAPQVGINKRLFITCHTSKLIDTFVYVNPVLMFPTDERIEGVEGCLSIPGERYMVERHKVADIEFFDQWGEKHQQHSDDFQAIVWQHEYDHLHGRLVNHDPSRRIKERAEAVVGD